MTPVPLLVVLATGPGPGCPRPVDPSAREEAYQSYVLGQVHANEGRFAEALAPLEGAIRADPLLPQARYALGQALIGLGRFPEAVAALHGCREVFRCLAELAGVDRADVERRLDAQIRELRDAIRSLERGELVKSTVPWREMNRSADRSRGEAMRLVHQLEMRLAELEAWRRRGLDARAPAVVSVALGTALFRAGDLGAAERAFRDAIAVEPKNGDAHHNLAVAALAQGRIGEAETEAALAARHGVPPHPRLLEEIRARKAAAPR